MSSRELQYRVLIDTSRARREARNIRTSIERELRQIQIGNIDVRGFQTATDQARRLREELDRAADEQERLNRTSRARTTGASGVTNIGSGQAIREIAQVTGVAFGAKQAIDFSVELSKLGTEANRTFKALEILSGGADVAAKRIDEIKDASGNTIDSLTAAGVATTILGQKLNTSITSFGELAKAARAIALLSPSINDAGDAIAQLSLFGANTKSFARADQLLVTAEEVKSRMKELAKENASLSESQLKVAATVDIVNEKFGSVLTSAEAQASGIERLTVAWKEFRIAVSTADFGPAQEFFSIDRFAGETAAALNAASKLINGESSNIEFAIDRIKDSLEFLNNEQNRFLFPADNSNEILELSNRLDLFTDVVDNVRAAVDAGVPSAAAYASTLDQMASTIGVTAGVTDDQVRALEAVNNWYNTVAQSAINAANANSENAQATTASANVQYTLAAAFDSGAISADNYIAILSNLTGGLYETADAANIASAAIAGMGAVRAAVQSNINTYGTANPYDTIYNLNSGPSAATGVPSLGIQRTDPYNTLIDILKKQSEETRKAAGYQAEQARKAATEQERSAKRAGSSLEKGAKAAAQELESNLRSVPGLFGRSQVTEKDFRFAEAGIYADKADEYLRRLQAEVEQGKDLFSDVSIEEARQALADLGVRVADDSKVAFEQFADAYTSGLLFFDPKNIEKFIDTGAVERELELQRKAQEGQQNILSAFGASIDGMAEAAVTGIRSAGGSSLTPSAALIPANGDLTAIPTLGGLSFDIETLQKQLNNLKLAPELDLTGAKQVLSLRSELDAESFGAMIEKIESTRTLLSVRTGLNASSFGDLLEKIESTRTGVSVATDLNITSFSDLLEKVGATRQTISITPTLAGDATIASAIAQMVATDAAALQGQGVAIGAILKSGLAQSFALQVEGDTVKTDLMQPFINRLGGEAGAEAQRISGIGQGIAEILKSGLAGSLVGSEGDTKLATNLLTAVNSQFDLVQNLFYASGQTPAISVIAGYRKTLEVGTDPTALVSPLLSAIGTGIRANAEDFRQRGGTMALELQVGFTRAFDSDSFRNTLRGVGRGMFGEIQQGLLDAASGAELVQALGAQILADIAETVEASQ